MFFPLFAFLQDTLQTTENPEPVSIALKTFVESSQVPLNRPVIFHVQLSWIGDISRFQVEPIPQPILTNLLLEGSGSSNKLEPLPDGRMRAVKTITYQFKPVEMGMAYIEGLVVKYKDRLTGEEDQLQSQRVMVEIIDPIPEEGQGGVKAVIYIILLVLFFGSMVYFLILYIRKRRSAREEPPPFISPAEQFLNRMAQEIDPRATNLPEMCGKLSRLFREYLAYEFRIPAREASSSELLVQLEGAGVNDLDLPKLKQVFEKLDRVKFAGEPIDPGEFSSLYGTIENFLIKQKKLWEKQQAAVKEE